MRTSLHEFVKNKNKTVPFLYRVKRNRYASYRSFERNKNMFIMTDIYKRYCKDGYYKNSGYLVLRRSLVRKLKSNRLTKIKII